MDRPLFLVCVSVLCYFAEAENMETFTNISTIQEKASNIEEFEKKLSRLEAEIVYLKSKGAKSCAELKQKSGFVKSGEYFIDPALSGVPIKVFCEMEMEETWISHDGEDLSQISFCTGDGCFKKRFVYEASDEHIEALKATSKSCYQELTYGCKMAPLKNLKFGHHYGWWTSKDGTKKFYMDGDNEAEAVCGCHATASCVQSLFNGTCNCDAVFLPLWTEDKGKVTSMEALPVRSFSYGGFISDKQEANITVGKMKCSGLREDTGSVGSSISCSSLKKDGAASDGLYLTKEETMESTKATYCQMSNQGFLEDDLKVESVNLFGGARFVLHIDLKSHYFQSNTKCYKNVCGSGVYYYKIQSILLKAGLYHVDIFQAFNTTDGTYKISESGLYTIIVGLGSYNGNCDYGYLVTAKQSQDDGKVNIGKAQFSQADDTNTYTQWFFQGTILQIISKYTGTVSETNFQLSILKH